MFNKENIFCILIAGTRTFDDYNLFCSVVDKILEKQTDKKIIIVEGEATGADALAKRYGEAKGYQVIGMAADWNKFGKSAGYRRNRKMHEYIQQYDKRGVLCFWDGESKGTAHNFQLSKEYNNPMRIYNYKLNKFVRV